MAKTELEPYPLHQSQLYKVSSRKKLAAEVFNVDLKWLERLAHHEKNFRIFAIVQSGKSRQVEVPKPTLERVHRRLFSLLERIEKPDYLHSGCRGRSYITNARAHAGPAPLVKLDLKKFYPSVDGARVARFFRETLNCSPDVAGLLTRLCVCENHVPTGSCVSQLLAYYAAAPMLDELYSLAATHGVRMTCYVDDLTFSGARATPSFLWAAKQIVDRHGFRYHKHRTYRADQDKVVTGAMIRGDRVTVISNREHDLARHIHALGGMDAVARLAAIDSLIGKASAAAQIDRRFLARVKRLRFARAEARREHEIDLARARGDRSEMSQRERVEEAPPW